MASCDHVRLSNNILANVLQAIAAAALLFALYRYINTALGVEQLGVWSVVLATVSASRLADLGLSAGVVRFVARDCARGEFDRAGRVIDTVALTLLLVVGAVLPLLYPLAAKLLPHLFQPLRLNQALSILPYTLVSLWLIVVAGVFQGGLDGCQRMDLRAGLVVSGQSLLLVLAFLLVPDYGLVGLAWAQIGQGLFLIIVGRFLLRRTLPVLPWLPRCWDKSMLREMLGYGANIQAATLFMMFFDPIAKILMARFGGPAAVGYFEMANQVALKVRALIVNANQAIVPHVAALADEAPNHLARLYHENIQAITFVTLPLFSLVITWDGAVSWLLTGAYQPEFVFILSILVLAWSTNVFTIPAYFSNMGTGRVGWNTLSHISMGVLNFGLGWIFGSFYGGRGVVFGYTIAVVIGSGVLISAFHLQNSLSWRGMFNREHIWMVFACLAVLIYGWYTPIRPSIDEPIAVVIEVFFLPLLVIGAATWAHPMRKKLAKWLASRKM